MTKAMTEGAKRRAKRQTRKNAPHKAECAISGVAISAEQVARQRAKQRDLEARRETLVRRCALMGMAPSEANLKSVDDQRTATLYGRLAITGRLAKSEQGADDAYRGLAEYDRLCRQYQRIVLGRPIPGDADGPAADDELDARALAGKWLAADAVLTVAGASVRRAVVWCVEDGRDVWPPSVAAGTTIAISLGGLALARHFGFRA